VKNLTIIIFILRQLITLKLSHKLIISLNGMIKLKHYQIFIFGLDKESTSVKSQY